MVGAFLTLFLFFFTTCLAFGCVQASAVNACSDWVDPAISSQILLNFPQKPAHSFVGPNVSFDPPHGQAPMK